MGTISDYSSTDTIARSKRGQASYSGGAKPIADSTVSAPLPNVVQWAKNFGSETLHMGEALAKKTGSFILNTPKYTYEGMKPFLDATAKVVTGNLNADNRQIESQRTQLDTMLNNAVVSYKSGKMSKDNYNKVLQEYGKSNQDLAKSAIDVEAQLAKQTHDIPVSAATTAATILLGGRLQLDSTPTAALRRTATAVSSADAKNTVVNSIIDQNATKLEKAFTTIPAVRDLLSRNLQYLGRREAQQLMGETTSQYVAREGKALAINMILKRPILYETNIQGAQQVYDKMIEGNYGDAAKQAAWLGTQMLKGGPLGASLSGLSWLKNKATKLSYGQGSFIDEISRQIGTKQSTQVADYLTNLKTSDPEKFKEAERVLRIVQEANLQMANNDAAQAANRVLQHWDEYGIQLDKVTPEKVVGLLKNWSDAHELKNALIKGGKIPGVAKNEADRFVVVRWDVAARKALADKLSEAGDDIQKQVDAYNTWRLVPGNAAGQNFILTNKIESILSKGLTGDELAQQVKDLSAASVMSKNIPDKYKAQFAKLGFAVAEPSEATKLTQKITPSVDYNDTRKLVTAVQNGPVTTTIDNPDLKNVSDNIIKDAQKSNTFDEFLNTQAIYRGQKKEFEKLQTVAGSDALSNILIGRGVFTTSDSSLAKKYGENVFTLKKPKDAKRILDLSNASTEQMDRLGIAKSTQKLYKELLDEGPDTGYYGKIYNIDGKDWRVANIVTDSRTGETQYKLANLSYGGGQKYINKAEFEAKYPPKTTYNSQVTAEDILFEQIVEKYLPKDVTWNQVKYGGPDAVSDNLYIDDVRDRTLQKLKEQGFDWIKHQGGIRAGGGEKLHDVYIALDDKVLKNVDKAKLEKIYNAAKNPTITNTFYPSEIFDIAQAPQPELNTAARTLESFGVSPVESNQVANRVLAQQVVADIDTAMAKQIGFSTNSNADTPEAGRYILSKLKQYIEDKQPSKIGNLFVANSAVGPAISDIRQLTTKEIMEALSVTSEQAKAISKAVVNAYAKVPMEYRGLGDKIVDNLYKFNPLQKYYSRIQSALRYTYNPFFRTQESFETMALSKAQARTPLWMMTKDELNNGAKILDEAGIFKTGLSGEAAQDLVLGRITANITPGQKRNLAGLAMSMAKSRNMTLQQMLEKHPQDVEDALRVVVQYPNRGILNSSLARTLNVAFFPMRYNAKVTKLSAEILAKEAPSVQLAVINSLFNLRDWLKSDEGIKWQSANNEAIQVFNWLTPVNSIEYGMQLLTHKPNSIGQLGSLGGLPLGFITQMLDSQGIINLNTPYVAPKTGDVFPKYIPETTKARAATAMGDLLNSMFTYPGRVLGLPGKNATINQVVRQFIDTHGTDFEKQIQTDRLTPLQQNWIRVLKGDTSQEAIDALYNSAAPGQFNWYTIPPLDLPIRTPYQQTQPVQQRTGLPKKASGRSKKVKPTALPIA